MLCGSCVWAYVIGSCCGILATLNPALLEYRQQLDELNVFLREHEMPQDIRVRLRGYFRNTLPIIRLRRYDHLLSKMSTRLRGDASLVVARHTFRSVGYLSHPDLEPEFLAHVTTRMRVAIYSRLEGINVIPAAISSSLAVPSLAYECAGSKHGPELKHALLSPRFLLSVANRSPAYSSWTEASAPSKERFALLAHAWART